MDDNDHLKEKYMSISFAYFFNFTFTLVDLSNLLHHPFFDDPCSSLLQMLDYFHHVLHGEQLIHKFVNMIVPLFVEGISVVCEVIVATFSDHKLLKEIRDCGILKILVVITQRPMGSLVSGGNGWNIKMDSGRIWGMEGCV